MPNIGAVFKQEISRLSRREIRGEVASLKRASAQFRKHIASMRQQLARLEKQLIALAKHAQSAPRAAGAEADTGKPLRFRAKALVSDRKSTRLNSSHT